MINSLHVLICKLMSPREDGGDDVDLHVKIFLSCCDRYSRGYYGDDVVPFWVGKGNFMGLLNLGKQIEKYGSLRWYWEGTHERFIQPVKSVLVSMRKGTGYLESKLLLIQKLNVLHWISDGWKNKVEEVGDTEGVGDMDDEGRVLRKWFRYDDEMDVSSRFKRGCVLSGFYNGGDIYVVNGKRGCKRAKFCILERDDDETIIDECGLCFWRYEMGDGYEEDVEATREYEKGGLAEGYCLMLPYRKMGERFDNFYAVILDDWDVVGGECNSRLPELCKKLFPWIVL